MDDAATGHDDARRCDGECGTGELLNDHDRDAITSQLGDVSKQLVDDDWGESHR
jgi:hypothetical protein